MTRALLLAALGTWLTAGCTGPAGCLEGACAEGTVCELDGRCRPLGDHDGHRFATARRLAPVDWAATHTRDRRANLRAQAQWALGGPADGEMHLVFEIPDREILEAVLTVTPVAEGPQGPARLLPFRTPYFEGARIDRSTSPRPRTRGHARRVRAQRGRPLRIDFTPLVRSAEPGRVHLGLAAETDQPLRVASPVARDIDTHPHLEVRWR